MRLFPRQVDSGPTAAAPLAPARRGETPLDILDRRLVSGEIDVAAYRRIRSAMDGLPDPDAHVAPGGHAPDEPTVPDLSASESETLVPGASPGAPGE